MRLTTWNVNSIKARLPRVLDYLKEAKPDAIVLQEIKCVDENFPRDEIEALGYTVETHGQKTYNGVALLSLHPISELRTGLPGDDSDEQARYIEAVIVPKDSAPIRLGGLYLPNGNPVSPDSEKYPYKLAWMDRLISHAKTLIADETDFILAGDYNVIPTDDDVHDPKAWEGDALFRPETHQKYRTLCNLGLTDAFRSCHTEPHRYSFWDYQAGAWQNDHGIRIDHLLLSPGATDRLTGAGIDKYVRGLEKPSDHVPAWADLI